MDVRIGFRASFMADVVKLAGKVVSGAYAATLNPSNPVPELQPLNPQTRCLSRNPQTLHPAYAATFKPSTPVPKPQPSNPAPGA